MSQAITSILNGFVQSGVRVNDDLTDPVDRTDKTKPVKPDTIILLDAALGLNIMIEPKILNPNIADRLFDLLSNIDYRSDAESAVKIGGTIQKIPRKQIAFGVKGATYHFSGNSVMVEDWDATHPNVHTSEAVQIVRYIASNLSNKFGRRFNYALINKYDDHNSYIGYHRDDEKDLSDKPMIIGISLGQSRDISFMNIMTGNKNSITLKHNSLMVIGYPTNTFYKHSVVKPTKHVKMGTRISLTFRSVK
jgi:hypothetical protein